MKGGKPNADSCRQGEGGSKITKNVQTSFMDGPLTKKWEPRSRTFGGTRDLGPGTYLSSGTLVPKPRPIRWDPRPEAQDLFWGWDPRHETQNNDLSQSITIIFLISLLYIASPQKDLLFSLKDFFFFTFFIFFRSITIWNSP